MTATPGPAIRLVHAGTGAQAALTAAWRITQWSRVDSRDGGRLLDGRQRRIPQPAVESCALELGSLTYAQRRALAAIDGEEVIVQAITRDPVGYTPLALEYDVPPLDSGQVGLAASAAPPVSLGSIAHLRLNRTVFRWTQPRPDILRALLADARTGGLADPLDSPSLDLSWGQRLTVDVRQILAVAVMDRFFSWRGLYTYTLANQASPAVLRQGPAALAIERHLSGGHDGFIDHASATQLTPAAAAADLGVSPESLAASIASGADYPAAALLWMGIGNADPPPLPDHLTDITLRDRTAARPEMIPAIPAAQLAALDPLAPSADWIAATMYRPGGQTVYTMPASPAVASIRDRPRDRHDEGLAATITLEWLP